MAEEKEPEQIDAYMGTMELYQKIYDFLLYIYPIMAQFPKFEKFALQTYQCFNLLQFQENGYEKPYLCGGRGIAAD